MHGRMNPFIFHVKGQGHWQSVVYGDAMLWVSSVYFIELNLENNKEMAIDLLHM